MNCSFGPLVFSAALGLGHSYRSAAFFLLSVIPFFFSTWETYHTGVLYLGYINGPTEGLIVACLLQLLSAIAGIQTVNCHYSIYSLYLKKDSFMGFDNRARMVDTRFTRSI